MMECGNVGDERGRAGSAWLTGVALGMEYEAGVKAAMAEARRASVDLHAHGTSWASGLGGSEVG